MRSEFDIRTTSAQTVQHRVVHVLDAGPRAPLRVQTLREARGLPLALLSARRGVSRGLLKCIGHEQLVRIYRIRRWARQLRKAARRARER